MDIFVTTAGRADTASKEEAVRIANALDIPYIERRKQSVSALQKQFGDCCLVAGKSRLELHYLDAEPFFYHPNMAVIRIKRMLAGKKDPFIETAGIKKGSRVLDCTLGLGADAVTASFAAGMEGRTAAIEYNPLLACLVERGMKGWKGEMAITEAMKRVEVLTGNHAEVMQTFPDKSFDVVYFDPMFEESIPESAGIHPLAQFASKDTLTVDSLKEAKRVAGKRIVLKDHFRSSRFEQFGFHQVKRKSSLFHYGYIDI